MKIILFIVQKEFKQIFRNKAMLPLLFVMPFMQLLILSNAASFEIKNIKIGFVNHDNSQTSYKLISKFQSVSIFSLSENFSTIKDAEASMEQGKVDVIVEIPNHLEKKLLNDNETSLSVIINAIDGAAAGIENVYVTQVIKDFNQSIKSELVMTSFDSENKPYFNVIAIPSFWYNNTLNYKTYMVPGILVLLVTMLTLFLSGMNIVREKEIGTLEQINVTPIKKHQFIVGKLFPFWVIGLLVLTIGLLIAKIVFSIPILGNVFIIYGFAALYLMVILGIGLFISNFTETQQQSMFISWFFMVVFILMSGLFTPIESMPVWAQRITYINPIRYFVEFTRMVMLKGSGFYEVRIHFIIIVAYAILVNFLAIWSYKKVN